MTSRRKFIKNSAYTGIFLCCGMAIDSCSNAKYLYLTGDSSVLKVKKSDFEQNNFIILKHPAITSPIYLSQSSGGDYSALLMVCTHKGCEIRPSGNFLICPCHGSEFSNTGKVLKPPAMENLKGFNTKVEGNIIMIEIK